MRQLFKQAAVVAAVFAAACSEQALEISVAPAATGQSSEKTFYASLDVETKTCLSMNDAGTHADVLWNAGDEIYVAGMTYDPLAFSGCRFITQDEGKLTASFSSNEWPQTVIDEVRAFYPPDLWPHSASIIEGGYICHAVSVPPIQQAVAGGLQKGLNMAVAQNKSSNHDELHFKNVLSLVRFRLSGSGVSKISKIRLSSGADISGDGLYSFESMSFIDGYYIPNAFQYGGKQTYVELKGPFVAGEDYYIAVIPCTLAGFDMIFTDTEGNQVLRSSTKTIELQRSRISDFGTINIEDSFSELPSGVERYMTHTKGSKPVCIAVLGDAFTATEQDKFKTVAYEAVDALFSTEPYKTYKDYFNVYIMPAVSNESGATVTDGNGNIVTPHDTFFGARWGESSYNDMTADFDRISRYVCSRCPEILNGVFTINEVPTLLIVNENRYGGKCFNWGKGRGIGIVPTAYRYSGGKMRWTFPGVIPASDESPDAGTRKITQEELDAIASPVYGNWGNIVIHEFGGHCIGRLLDEYWYNPIKGEGPIDDHSNQVPSGLNISSSYSDVPWQSVVLDVVSGNSDITVDPVKMGFYSSREGIFQGGDLCALGRWRSEFVSCMTDNRKYFSLWQRMLIVDRIMSLSGETFDLQDFYDKDVPYDPSRDPQAAGAPAQIARKAGSETIVHKVPMLPPPRIFNY